MHLQEMLVKSQDYFVIYSQKTPTEIEDGKYDETEYLLFSHIDQINGLDVIFTKDEIKTLKMKMVLLISQSFQAEQLEVIARVGRTSQLNKKQAATYFEFALEYKLGRLSSFKFSRYR